jgi:4-amino-4-deoxy-L-arabinose transferase-like glycosyltransferase
MFGSEDVFELMQIQRILSGLISISIIIPVYFLCKKFVARKFAVIGASLVAFDPRLMLNSFLGITDPLYLLLITTSLTLFLYSNQKLVYFSFILVALSTLIRSEGVVFFVGMLIVFFIRYRNEKLKIILKYIVIIGIFSLIILPLSIYKLDVTGNDGIFLRASESVKQVLDTEKKVGNERNSLISGLELLIKYLIWIMIPNFIIFIPLGIFLIFKKKTIKNMSIIILSGIMLIPALYAYFIPALDTRYLYTLFPIFSVLAVLSIDRIVEKIKKPNIIIVVIISAIIISSVLFYDYKKIDYEHERESFEIMKEVSLKVKGVNNLPTESRYLSTIQTINQWPTPYLEIEFNIEIISYQNEDNLQDWISKSKDKGLTHILIDDNKQRPDFLKEIFFEETKYTYLKKIYDSRNQGFDYQLKVFEINYELFESLKR